MTLLRGLHAATFQVKVFRWLVVFIHRDALDGGIGSEILQVVEGYHAGGFILLDVVERTGGQGAPVELHLCETVDVLAVFACVIGWERVVLETQGIFIPGVLVGIVVATVCLVDNETIGRHHHYSWHAFFVVRKIAQTYSVFVGIVDAPYQHAISHKILIPALVSDILEQQEFALGSLLQVVSGLVAHTARCVVRIDEEVFIVHVGINLIGLRCHIVWLQGYLCSFRRTQRDRVYPSHHHLLPWGVWGRAIAIIGVFACIHQIPEFRTLVVGCIGWGLGWIMVWQAQGVRELVAEKTDTINLEEAILCI